MASNLRVDSIVPSTSGNVSIGTATGGVTIPGNLGISGVLTYEDVTNIDSVGVITARGGIKLGATGANTLISGNATGIGIGTDNPLRQLQILGGADTCVRLISSAGGVASYQLGDTTDHIKAGITFKSNDNSLRIRGHNNDDRIIINSNGIVTKPNQPAFNVKGTNMVRNDTSGYICQFDDKSDTGCFDNGGNFNTSTYKFTAPVTGTYYFFTNIRLDSFSSGYIRTGFLSTNHGTSQFWQIPETGHVISYYNSPNNIKHISTSTVMQLDANDEVYVYQDPNSDTSFTCYLNESSFGGYLIG